MKLMGPYAKYTIKQNPGGSIIQNNDSLNFITMVDTTTGQFRIVEVPCFDLEEVAKGNT